MSDQISSFPGIIRSFVPVTMWNICKLDYIHMKGQPKAQWSWARVTPQHQDHPDKKHRMKNKICWCSGEWECPLSRHNWEPTPRSGQCHKGKVFTFRKLIEILQLVLKSLNLMKMVLISKGATRKCEKFSDNSQFKFKLRKISFIKSLTKNCKEIIESALEGL